MPVLTSHSASNPLELGFGAAPLGNLYAAVDDERANATLEAAWDAGIRHFDTAPHYGLGLSERRLGAFLATRRREEYVLSTKVGRLLEPNPCPVGSDLLDGGFDVPDTLRRRRDYSAAGVRQSLEASLGRLGVDYVDIVYVHDPDDHLAQTILQALPALRELRGEGVIGACGVGMNDARLLQDLVVRAEVDAVMIAGRWTLLDRTAKSLLDTCHERGVRVAAAAPFNSGLLAQSPIPDDATFNYAPTTAAVLALAREIAARCEAHGVTLPAAALQFPAKHHAVDLVVTGLGDPAHVEAAVTAASAAVPEDLYAEIDQLLERMPLS